jgi:hypothetical protein
MEALIGEATREAVAGVRWWPLQHGGRVGGEVPVYLRGNGTRSGHTIRGAIGGAFGRFPVNNGGLR